MIAGGESGPRARPMQPEWARSIRDQCLAAGVPFFFKQWGAHDASGARMSKKRAGRLLDGRTWDEAPPGGATARVTLVPASDGLPARVVHRWSDEKLFYLDRYMDIFTTGMKNLGKEDWSTLISSLGPAYVSRRVPSAESHRLAILRALKYGFSRIFLNDADPEAVDALRRRIQRDGRVRIDATRLQ